MNRLLRSLLYLAFLGAAVFFLVSQLSDAKSALQAFFSINRFWIATAVAAQTLSYVASGQLICAAVQLSGQSVKLSRGILITLASNTIGTLGSGFIGTAMTSYHWMRGGGIDRRTAALTGWLPSLFNNSVLIALANWGLIILIFRHRVSASRIILFVLLELFVIVALIGMHWAVKHQAQIKNLIQRTLEFWARLWRRQLNTQVLVTTEEWFASIGLLSGGKWQGPLLLAILNTGFDIATLFLLFKAVRHPISVGTLLSGYALPQVVGGILMLPGGVGAVEATMIGIYVILGFPRDLGLVVVLSYRVISFWIPTFLGLAAAPYLERTSISAN